MNDTELTTELNELAPEVDLDASRNLFQRRSSRNNARRRLTLSAAAALTLAVGAAAVIQLDSGDQLAIDARDDTEPMPEKATEPSSSSLQSASGVRFQVLAELEPNSAPSTKPIAATNQDELNWMWDVLGQPAATTPEVDFDNNIVIAATVPGNGCRSELTRIDTTGTELVVELESPDRVCNRPLLLWTAVVSVERNGLPASFEVVVPTIGPDFGYDDARLRVELNGQSGEGAPATRTGDEYPPSINEVDGEVITVEPSDGPPARVGLDSQFGLCAEARNVYLGCTVPSDNAAADPYAMITAVGPPGINESIDDALDLVHAYLPEGAETVLLTYADGSTSSTSAVLSTDRTFWAAPVSDGIVPTKVAYLDREGRVIITRPTS